MEQPREVRDRDTRHHGVDAIFDADDAGALDTVSAGVVLSVP
jgi:hypothetical protein